MGLGIAAKVRILGSGTSTGVPVIGCPCAICTGTEPLNKRLRSSILLTRKDTGAHILFDTTPDLRLQVLAAKVTKLDTVLYTHTHADHCHGFDDLRAFYFFTKKPVTAWLSHLHISDLRSRFAYAFEDTGYVGTKPQVELSEFADAPFTACGLTVHPLALPHGHATSIAFRIGDFAYATDFKEFPPAALQAWKGKVKTMVASGLHFKSHPTHSCIPETLALFAQLGVEQGYITHLSHMVDHRRDEQLLPANVQLAFDGLEFDIEL